MKPFAAENIPNTRLNDDAQVDGGAEVIVGGGKYIRINSA